MRICRVTQNFKPGDDGLSNHIFHLCRYQALRGHQVYLLQPYTVSGVRDGIHFVLIHTGRLVSIVPYTVYTIIFSMYAVVKIALMHKKEAFHMIHCHGDAIEALFIGCLGKILSVPVVQTIHGGLNKQGKLYKLLARIFFKLVDGYIPISNTVKADLQYFGVPDSKMTVVSSGIIYSEYMSMDSYTKGELRRKYDISPLATVIVAVGRLHPVKGFKYVIEAASMFVGVERPLFIIIGDGPQRAELHEKARGMSYVILAGKCSHRVVLEYLRAADVFILSSIDLKYQSEAIPTTLIEALAMGLPVISTDTGEGKHLVKNGFNGFVIKQRSPQAIHEAIEKIIPMLKNMEYLANASAYGKEIARNRDWSILVQQVDNVYGQVMADKEKR
ncbi:MAG: glycosyltransferase family 4 protein [Nitrospirae bacterium]|nr:glycosyltransferase family 4 protein [Nitrospirota bacterium]